MLRERSAKSFLLIFIVLSGLAHIGVIRSICKEGKGLIEPRIAFLPPGNHQVYLDIRLASENSAIVTLTFQARDQLSWLLISSLYARQRPSLISDFKGLISDVLQVDEDKVERRELKIDLENLKVWMVADVNLSGSASISREGREIRFCLVDPIFKGLYEGAWGWIDRINVTVSEGLRIVDVTPGENLVQLEDTNALWEIPSMEKASESYCVKIRTKGILPLGWIVAVASFAILALLYFLLSRRLRKGGEVSSSLP